jgi:hypothetical protein
MLQPLSARGIQHFLQEHTLPAAEIRCSTGWVTQVPPRTHAEADPLPSQESLPRCLNLCGWVALIRLHEDELVNGLGEAVDGVVSMPAPQHTVDCPLTWPGGQCQQYLIVCVLLE